MARHFYFLRVCLGEARFEIARLVGGGCRLDQRWRERWNGHKDLGESRTNSKLGFFIDGRRTASAQQQTPRHEHTPRHGKGMVQHSGRQGSGGAMVSLGLFFFSLLFFCFSLSSSSVNFLLGWLPMGLLLPGGGLFPPVEFSSCHHHLGSTQRFELMSEVAGVGRGGANTRQQWICVF